MKTRMMTQFATTATLMMLLASCSPSSSNNSAQTFQTAGTGSSDSNNIVNGVGSTSEFQKANGVVGLLLVFENSKGQQGSATCTASLIAPSVALTAAHCLVLPPSTKLVAALIVLDTDFSKVMEEINHDDLSHVRIVNEAKRHEAYLRGKNTNNDIGLVRFGGTLPPDFQLARLADPQWAPAIRKGDSVTLAGFGVSQYQINPSTGKPDGSGDGLLRQIDGIRILSLTPTGEEITLDQSQGRGACHGDSGGPAYMKDASGKNVLVGVTSRGTNPQGLCDRQAIYTGVVGYAQWIQNGLKELTAAQLGQDVKPSNGDSQPKTGSGQQVAVH